MKPKHMNVSKFCLKIIVLLFGFCSLFAGMVHAKTTLSFEQWKARQERIDQRLMDQRLKEQQFQSITPQSTAQTLLTTTQNTTTPQVADSTITQIQPQRLGEAVSININQATAQEITAKLDGIGRKKAQAIVQYRKHHGDFKKVDELMQVKGIGEKTLAKNRSRIRLKP
jgi:competence protein ComEA